jgi:hypothetical protein
MAADFEEAAKLATGAKRVELGVKRALALAYTGDNEKALAEVAAALKGAKEIPPESHFDHARILGRAAKAAKKPDEAEDHARRAVAELRAATEAGFFRATKNITLLDRHLDLTALRTRDDYKALRAKIRKP